MTRKDVGLPDNGFVFCCFNNTYKMTPTTFDSWARILKAVRSDTPAAPIGGRSHP
nr:hypothetical protein [Candidatus Pseudothioglobus singularis]